MHSMSETIPTGDKQVKREEISIQEINQLQKLISTE